MKQYALALTLAVASMSAFAETADAQIKKADPNKQYMIDRVAQFDTDKDGVVSEKEFFAKCPNGDKALFAKADKNSNKELSQVEIRTAKEYLFKGCEALKAGDSKK
jgi:hypothetical protein